MTTPPPDDYAGEQSPALRTSRPLREDSVSVSLPLADWRLVDAELDWASSIYQDMVRDTEDLAIGQLQEAKHMVVYIARIRAALAAALPPEPEPEEEA